MGHQCLLQCMKFREFKFAISSKASVMILVKTNLLIVLLLLLLPGCFSCVQLCVTPETRLPCPWDSPGKNTGVGCHFLLQSMKVKSESEVAQSCSTPSDPMDCSLPGSSVHGIFQARVLEWVAIAFSILNTQLDRNTNK